nr:hypothetical protein [Rhizobium etli]
MMIDVCSMGMVLCGGYLLAASAGGLGGAENALSDSPLSMADVSNFDTFIVRSPPTSLSLDPFYAKYADAAGIPIISSNKVPDTALLIARDIVFYMLSERRDVRDDLIRAGARVGIMAIDETTTDLPEQRDWQKPAPDDPRLTPRERRNYAKTIAKMTARGHEGRAAWAGSTRPEPWRI